MNRNVVALGTPFALNLIRVPEVRRIIGNVGKLRGSYDDVFDVSRSELEVLKQVTTRLTQHQNSQIRQDRLRDSLVRHMRRARHIVGHRPFRSYTGLVEEKFTRNFRVRSEMREEILSYNLFLAEIQTKLSSKCKIKRFPTFKFWLRNRKLFKF